jgi:hypothetical protein
MPELRLFGFLRPFSVEKHIRFLSSLMLLGYIAYKMLFYKQGLDGLEKLVSDYPNSVFFALMGSYFFMCVSVFFEGLLYSH